MYRYRQRVLFSTRVFRSFPQGISLLAVRRLLLDRGRGHRIRAGTRRCRHAVSATRVPPYQVTSTVWTVTSQVSVP